jgi:hypothetical protein
LPVCRIKSMDGSGFIQIEAAENQTPSIMKTLNAINPLRDDLKHLARAVAGAVLLTVSARAEEMIVNIQFYMSQDAAPSMTDVQGPVESADTTPAWNRFTGDINRNADQQWGDNLPQFNGGAALALVKADGTASGLTLSITGNGTRRPASWGLRDYPAGGIPVFGGGAYVDQNGRVQTQTISGLTTGVKYDLYVMNSAGAEGDMFVTANNGTQVRLRGAYPANGAFDGTALWTSFITKMNNVDEPTATANTAYFKDLTPTAGGTLSFSVNNANTHHITGNDFSPIGVGGVQLVQVTFPTTTPAIIAVGSPLAAMNTTYGTASAETRFTVSGTDMLAGILVSPPAGFEVSQTSGSDFAATTTVGAAGTIDPTTVYVRLAATAPVLGTYNDQNIGLSSSIATPVNVSTAVSGNTVLPKSLTVTATGPAKSYGITLVEGPSTTDFTADATGVGSEALTSVTLTPDAAGALPTTAVGAGYVITPTAATGTGGFLASNYEITYAPYAGTVVKGTPTLSVTNSPVIYDGSSQAAEVSSSVDGIVSNVKYDGSGALPTAAGTYAVTADFAPTAPGNYDSLNEAPAGNFVIVKHETMMVNVQFYETANSSPSMTNQQGPVTSYDTTPTWNQFTGNWTYVIPTGGPEALVQADGTASGITLSMTGARRGGSWGGQGTDGIAMFGGGAYWDSGGDQTAVFSGLTVGAMYDLYVMNAAGSMSDSRFTVNGNTPGAIRLRGAIAGFWPGAWSVDGTTDWTQWVTTTTDAGGDDPLVGSTANTAYFKDLAPDADGKLTIVMSHANTHRSDDFSAIAVAGFQLVEVAGGTVSDYDTWAGTGGYNLSGGPAEDDDGDSLSNFMEYAFGLNPTSGLSVNPITRQLDKTTGIFRYTRRATPTTTGVNYIYEWSTTLSEPWGVFTPDSASSNLASPVEEITVDVPDVLLSNPKLFLRVRAE